MQNPHYRAIIWGLLLASYRLFLLLLSIRSGGYSQKLLIPATPEYQYIDTKQSLDLLQALSLYHLAHLVEAWS